MERRAVIMPQTSRELEKEDSHLGWELRWILGTRMQLSAAAFPSLMPQTRAVVDPQLLSFNSPAGRCHCLTQRLPQGKIAGVGAHWLTKKSGMEWVPQSPSRLTLGSIGLLACWALKCHLVQILDGAPHSDHLVTASSRMQVDLWKWLVQSDDKVLMVTVASNPSPRERS